MPSRRQILASFTSGLIVGATGTGVVLSQREPGFGSIAWGNYTEEDVLAEIVVQSTGGALSEPTVEYENRLRVRPTDTYAAVETNVVGAGDYDVTVRLEPEAQAQQGGPFTTRWSREECQHQKLNVEIEEGLAVQFSQREC